MDKIEIRLQVPTEWNEIRKTNGQTWRDIIQLGLDSFTKDQFQNSATASAQLKIAVEAIMRAHNILKGKNTP
jgi:hypothetical protein